MHRQAARRIMIPAMHGHAHLLNSPRNMTARRHCLFIPKWRWRGRIHSATLRPREIVWRCICTRGGSIPAFNASLAVLRKMNRVLCWEKHRRYVGDGLRKSLGIATGPAVIRPIRRAGTLRDRRSAAIDVALSLYDLEARRAVLRLAAFRYGRIGAGQNRAGDGAYDHQRQNTHHICLHVIPQSILFHYRSVSCARIEFYRDASFAVTCFKYWIRSDRSFALGMR